MGDSLQRAGTTLALFLGACVARDGYDRRDVELGAVFSIRGVSGGSDAKTDAWLSGNSDAPVLAWGAATGATVYDVVVLAYDGLTERCAARGVVATEATLAGCALVDGTSYRARVVARDERGRRSLAQNDLFIFTRLAARSDSWSVAIAATEDDGWLWAEDPGFGQGNDAVWCGEWRAGYPEFCYLRFSLPGAIPGRARVANARLRMWGIDTDSWDTAVDALLVRADVSGDARQVEDQTYYPGEANGPVLTTTEVLWQTGAGPGLTWVGGAWNESPDLGPVVQEVVDARGGLSAGAHLQLWVTTAALRGAAYDLEAEDYSHGNGHPAELALEVRVDAEAPTRFAVLGVGGGVDQRADAVVQDVAAPRVYWQDALGESSYAITILGDDGTTVECATVEVGEDVTHADVPACTLTPGGDFRAQVVARDAAGASTVADNAPFRFHVGEPGVVLVQPVYPRHANWLDYVQNHNGGTSRYDQPDQTCNIGAVTDADSCVHAGILRQAFPVGVGVCTGITASDSLGAFHWRCDDAGGSAVVRLGGLREDKGLADLVTATAWRDNALEIRRDGIPVATSANETWWSNPVAAVPTGPGVQTLDQSGTIYVFAGDVVTDGVYLARPRVALVGLAGATMRYSGAAAQNCAWGGAPYSENWCVVFSDQNQLWIEGHLRGDAVPRAPEFGLTLESRMSTVRNVAIWNLQDLSWALHTHYCVGSRFENLRLTNNNHIGFYVQGGEGNVIHNLVGANNGRVLEAAVAPANWTLTRLVLASSYGPGMTLMEGTTGFTLSHYSSLNNEAVSQIGVSIGDSDANTFLQGAMADAFELVGTSNGNELRAAAVAAVVPNGNVNATLDGVVTPADLSATFVGPVTSDDARNVSDSNGVASHSPDLDWTDFETGLRGWGLSSAGSFEYGRCGPSETCQIWDYRLSATDTVALAVNDPFVPGQPCPATAYPSHSDGSGRTYLVNALELIQDGAGNDNGLCESGEDCVYSPNLGAFQGEGDPRSRAPCVFQDGPVSGVTLFAHPADGV